MSKFIKAVPPYLGSAYYPEARDLSEIDFDIEMMNKAGLNVVRVGEFAWSSMEFEEGLYTFNWLHTVIDKCAAAGIGVMLGTPTATPPAWLTYKYPDINMMNENGQRASHGGRRHACSNNEQYNEYSSKIVEKMAVEFGNHPNVIGWQIDNEIYLQGKGCFCPVCCLKFKEYLIENYKNIEALNSAWNLVLWSQAYNSFEQIPVPKSNTWQNPHLRLDWILFQAKSHINFIQMQAKILKKYTKDIPVGTDMMPINALDYNKINENLDVVQFNHYNSRDNLWRVMLWFDYIRTIKDRPFWNTETSATWNGSTAIDDNIKPEGFCYINSMLPFAFGGEANLYWLWRAHSAGHELVHGSVISTCGRPSHTFKEIQNLSQDLKFYAPYFEKTKIEAKAALHFTSHVWNMFDTQSVHKDIRYQETVADYFYKPVIESGVRPDVIDSTKELSGYSLIISPLMLTLEENGLAKRMKDWVGSGGVWIVGPFSDIRDINGAKYKNKPFGLLEEFGLRNEYQVPDKLNSFKFHWRDGEEFKGNIWFDFFDINPFDNLAACTEGYSTMVNRSIICTKKYGKGTVIVLGTLPSYKDMRKLLDIVYGLSKVKAIETIGKVAVIPRKGQDFDGYMVLEYEGNPAKVYFEDTMLDIKTERMLMGEINLKPYEFLFLKKI